jgi:copper transport protein
LAVLLLSFPASAGAHAVLVSSAPRWGGALSGAPRSLRLEYSEDVVGRYARVTVVTADGRNLARRARAAGPVVVVALRPGPKGSYTVHWQMVASDDGHVTEGAFSYGVGVKPLPPGPVPGVGVPVAPELLAWLEFLGVALAGGMLVFRALVWAPAAWVLGEAGPRDTPVAIWAAVAGAVLALHAGMLAFLVGAYPIVGAGGLANFADAQIVPIRIGTHLGQAFAVMTFAWLLVLALLVSAWVTPRIREELLASAGALSLALALGISWASHPASRGTLALAADYVHLLAAALWVGGLLGLLILAGVMRPLSRTARDAVFRASLLRFSRVAMPTVVVLALAGAYLALRELPGPSALFTSGWGITLLLKSLVALGAVTLGGYHHRFVVPRLAAGARVATIRRTLSVEASLLLLALALAAVLGQSAPPG